MMCAWKELLEVLPPRMRQGVDELSPRMPLEIRLRMGQPVEVCCKEGSRWLPFRTSAEDMRYILNLASRYSPWARETMAQGYLTAVGGHRIGICGECVVQGGNVTGIREVTSLCIRIARDFLGIARSITQADGSVLILGPPGSGKTTLLRDLIRQTADREEGYVAAVDERGELFPAGMECRERKRLDVLSGCPKAQGISMALRTMGPRWIAVDEITAPEDCGALLEAGWCGVKLLGTAHAANRRDLYGRKVYQSLAESGLFDTLVILQRDKSWRKERMKL